MRNPMKVASLVVIFALVALIGPSAANATSATSPAGAVSFIHVTKSTTGSNGGSSHFALTGVGSGVGACAAANGYVIFKFTDADKNILSTVQAAFLSGKTIAVQVDDAVKLDGYCRVQDVWFQ